jgi:hypothetical protein
MKRLLKRVCFVIPMGLANLIDDLIFMLSLSYLQGPGFAMRFAMWWFKRGFGQY